MKHYLQATQHDLYAMSSTPMMRDMFSVYFAQLRLMEEGGRYVPSAEYASWFAGKMKLQQFNNNLEVSEKDKSGISISILFIDIAFQVIRKKSDDLGERFEAIQKYLQRYAEEEGKGRVYSYAKLIEGGIRYDWNLKKLKSSEFDEPLHHLESTEVDMLNMRFEVEVIAYEEIWKFLLERIL